MRCRLTSSILAACLISFLHAVPSGAQGQVENLRWARLLVPPGRFGHTIVYDSIRRRLVLFGGTNGTYFLNDTWVLPLDEGSTWMELKVRGAPPSGRHGHAAVYDPGRNRMIVFGGRTADGLVRDTWSLVLDDEPRWQELAAATGISPREGHAMVVDAGGLKAFLFGGVSASGYLNDLWILDLRDNSWVNQPAVGGPIARRGHSLTCDPEGNRLVLFGGEGDDFLSDLWTLDLGSRLWTRQDLTGSPPGRRDHVAGIDAASSTLIIAGGRHSAVLNDTWTLDLRGGIWSRVPTSGLGRRFEMAGAVDPAAHRLVIFGGQDATSGPLDDTRAYDISGNAWSTLANSSSLPRLYGASAIYDPLGDRVVLFGGADSTGNELGATWELPMAEGSAWRPFPVSTGPGRRVEHTAVYDSKRRRMVVHGGFSGLADLDDTWGLQLDDAPGWQPLSIGPRARQHVAIYDPTGDRLIIHGGVVDGNRLSSLSFVDATWTGLTAGGVGPAPRQAHSAVYDPVGRRLVLWGGIFPPVGLFGDAWALNLTGEAAWEPFDEIVSIPLPRVDHKAVYDPLRRRMLLFGGQAGGFIDTRNDVWALTLNENPEWVRLQPFGIPPLPRTSPAVVYDPVRDRMIVIGGITSSSSLAGVMNDVWALELGGGRRLTSLNVFPGGVCLSAGDTLNLRVSAAYSDGFTTDLSTFAVWTISDPLIADIDADGRLRAHAAGTAMITARLADAFDEIPLTVAPALLPEQNFFLHTEARVHVSFSVPVKTGSLTAKLGPVDPAEWRLWSWSSTLSRYEEETSGTLRTGVGYWLITRTPREIQFQGPAAVACEQRFDLGSENGRLTGWNFVGNPFTQTVPVSDLIVSDGSVLHRLGDAGNNLTESGVWVYDSELGRYSDADSIRAGQAFFIRKLVPGEVNLQVPDPENPVPNSPGPGRIGSAGPRAPRSRDDQSPWTLRLTAASGSERTESLILGTASVPPGAWNSLCRARPPAPPEARLSLYSVEADWGDLSGAYLKDYHADGFPLLWNLVVEKPGGGRVSIDTESHGLPEGTDILFFDGDSGEILATTGGQPIVPVDASGSRRLRISVGGSLAGAAVLQAFPNPFSDRVRFTFGMDGASKRDGRSLTLTVLDVSGRAIRHLVSGVADFSWDGRDESGHAVPSGLYFGAWCDGIDRGVVRLMKLPR